MQTHKTYRNILVLLISLCIHGDSTAQYVTAVQKITLTVSDLEASEFFFTTVLEFEKTGEYLLDSRTTKQLFGTNTGSARIVSLKLGDEMIELMEFEDHIGRPVPADSKSNDLWFQHIAIVVSDMPEAYEKLRGANVTHVSTSPQTLPEYIPAAAGITAFYFRDTDGHNLELIQYPKGKGNPKWQDTKGKLFLGIDHTAIGIEDTKQSEHFYDQLLGLSIAGHSENYGTEQEHLNQVFGARLLITGLKASEGFGIEFLDYIAPPGGRPYPAGSIATDLWHWHTTLRVEDIEVVYSRLREQHIMILSNGIVRYDDDSALLIRDRDGHAILLLQEGRYAGAGD